jgi:hypothetical protein
MSYLSRLYNHRNAQSPDVKEKPFFSKQHAGNDVHKKNAFFQAKLSVNKPGDKYEHEADSVANAVVNNKNAKPAVQQKEITSVQRLATSKEDEILGTNDARMERDKEDKLKSVQRSAAPEKEKDKGIQKMDAPKKEEEKKPRVQKMELPEKKKEETGPPPVQKMGADPEKEKIHKKAAPLKEEEKKPAVQKMELPEKKKEETGPPPVQKMGTDPEKEKKMQKKDDPLKEEEKKHTGAVQKKHEGTANTASPKVASALKNSAGKGRRLPQKTMREMSTSFGVDFSSVKVHDDTEATHMNEELNAQAFTHGNDIYFNAGKFNPDHGEGKHLLAHELAHVVQQNKDSFLQRKTPDEKSETEKKYSILIQKGDKDWSETEMNLLFAALKSLSKDEGVVLRNYRFIRWSTKAARAKLDPTYVDPGTDECGLHEADLKNGIYKISMYDACFDDPEAVSQKTAGIDSGQFNILHEIGHAMQTAELRNTSEASRAENAKYNKAVDAYNKAGAKDQDKMKPGIDKLGAADVAAEEAMKKSEGRSLKDLEKLIEGKTPLTEYSETNSQEAFADAFAIYKADPVGFKKLNLKLYDWFNKGGFLKPTGKK